MNLPVEFCGSDFPTAFVEVAKKYLTLLVVRKGMTGLILANIAKTISGKFK